MTNCCLLEEAPPRQGSVCLFLVLSRAVINSHLLAHRRWMPMQPLENHGKDLGQEKNNKEKAFSTNKLLPGGLFRTEYQKDAGPPLPIIITFILKTETLGSCRNRN